MSDSDAVSRDRLERERDLFVNLLTLADATDVAPYVGAALDLLVRATSARHGYVEVQGGVGGAPLASASHGLSGDELRGVRERLSSGIVRDAITRGVTITTASAVDDPRYLGLESVKQRRIQAVLCAPLGDLGVLYLEGRAEPGPFSEPDRKLVEIAARALAPTVERMVDAAERAERDETRAIRARLDAGDVAGKSRALALVLEQIAAAAQVPVAVLLRGESGTGKSALARILHRASPRASGPFVEVNAAALPESLFESELFGAEKGAHSQAAARIAGKVDAAQGGTLFLDEIGELSLVSQAKLLSFLQTKRFMRLGGTAPVAADVRIVAATNADLEEAVRAKTFRQDLYYRLNVLEITVPALRDRREDIPDIARAIAARVGDDETLRLPLSRDALRALADAEWPGNIRQLENAIARGWAAALGKRERAIEAHHLFGDKALREEREPGTADAFAGLSFQEATRRFQARLVQETLTASDWNVSETARKLDMSRSHLNDLIKAFGLARRKAP